MACLLPSSDSLSSDRDLLRDTFKDFVADNVRFFIRGESISLDTVLLIPSWEEGARKESDVLLRDNIGCSLEIDSVSEVLEELKVLLLDELFVSLANPNNLPAERFLVFLIVANVGS